MAPVDDGGAESLARFLDKDVPELFTRYDVLWEAPEPEENPYKSKYEGRKLLEDARVDLERLINAEPETSGVRAKGRDMAARFALILGKNYYFCEEVPEAERLLIRALEQYLRSPSRLEPEHFVQVQDTFNQLGMLWCNRQAHGQGMNFLRRAQIMFEKRPEAVRKACEQKAADNYTLTMFYLAQAYGALQKPGLSARFCAETMSQQLEHNTSGQRPQEAKERDPFDCKDWVRNCCSLSDFFVNECMFWTAEYLLQSAAIMCERCEEICGIKPEGLEELTAECKRDLGNYYSTRLKFAKTCAEYPGLAEEVWSGERKPAKQREPSEGTKLSFRCSADAASGKLAAIKEDAEAEDGAAAAIAWDEVFPEVVFLEDEEDQDKRLAEEETGDVGAGAASASASAPAAASGPSGAGEGGELRNIVWLEYGIGQRVRLPVFFRRLHGLVEHRIRKANASFLAARAAELAAAPAKSAPTTKKDDGEADPSERPPPTCAGTSFEAARELFKIANHYQQRALEYFLLDGWATEHTRVMQELSQMYRSILFWESDPKRSAAMLSRRLRLLAPLLDLLNPKVYVAFTRQLAYELAEVCQQIYELRALGKLPERGGRTPLDDDDDEDNLNVKMAARCNTMAEKSLTYYGRFVESYHERGVIPKRIDDDNVRVYLTARLNRARLRTKVRGLKREELLEAHKLALREYEWILDYGRRNPEVISKPEIGMATEFKLCEEMVGMLPARLSRLAAGR